MRHSNKSSSSLLLNHIANFSVIPVLSSSSRSLRRASRYRLFSSILLKNGYLFVGGVRGSTYTRLRGVLRAHVCTSNIETYEQSVRQMFILMRVLIVDRVGFVMCRDVQSTLIVPKYKLSRVSRFPPRLCSLRSSPLFVSPYNILDVNPTA